MTKISFIVIVHRYSPELLFFRFHSFWKRPKWERRQVSVSFGIHSCRLFSQTLALIWESRICFLFIENKNNNNNNIHQYSMYVIHSSPTDCVLSLSLKKIDFFFYDVVNCIMVKWREREEIEKSLHPFSRSVHVKCAVFTFIYNSMTIIVPLTLLWLYISLTLLILFYPHIFSLSVYLNINKWWLNVNLAHFYPLITSALSYYHPTSLLAVPQWETWLF